MLEVITIETPSLGDRSYVVHDGRQAIVVDPVRDIDRIEAVLDEHGLSAELILETHVHNDYITGGLTLSRTTGATYVHAAAETVHVDHRGVADGDRLEVGSLTVDVVATVERPRSGGSVSVHGSASVRSLFELVERTAPAMVLDDAALAARLRRSTAEFRDSGSFDPAELIERLVERIGPGS